MRKPLLALGILIGLPFLLYAQKNIPLLTAGGDSPRLSGASADAASKYQIANAVYQRLVAARGDARYPAPRFTLSRATTHGAMMNYDSMEITLEERAYDVCAGFGEKRDAALAIILGHELIHYYEKHGWRRGFAYEYYKLPIGMKLSETQDVVTHETQADYLGGFLAYSAGFPLFDQAPDLIAGMYKAYKLPDKLEAYPSLQDRQALSRHTIQKLELLVDAFEVANLMVALGEYAQARVYYQYVLRDYQSRELFNNVGVCALLEVLNQSELKMTYPVELDLNSRTRRGNGFSSNMVELIQLAIQNFDAATNMDPDYAPAYLNKACAYALLEDQTRARFYAEVEAMQKAQKAGLTKTASDVEILLGILAYSRGDSLEASKYFEHQAADNPLAAKNLRALRRQPESQDDSSPLGFGFSFKTENIDSISLPSFSQDPQFNQDRTQKLDEKTILFQYQVPNKSSKVYICRAERRGETTLTFFHQTRTGKPHEKLDIGATRDDIIKVYKKPQRVVETASGSILVYKKQMMILDEKNKLRSWVNYLLPE